MGHAEDVSKSSREFCERGYIACACSCASVCERVQCLCVSGQEKGKGEERE